uniref:ABC transmembrane type-1 domain-containing protein n=1 Tax=Mesocestoides corti TaxID=53468 RepID=A0A5K3G0A3_MESCO
EEDGVKTREIDGGSPSEIDRLSSISQTGSDSGQQSFRESEAEGEVSDVFMDFPLDKKHESVTRRTLKWNKPEGLLMAVGFLGAAVSGAIEPSFALLFAETFVTFQQVMLGNEITDKARLITGLMSAVGFVKLLAQILQYWLLAITGERLTRRVRRALFEAMLRQEPGWFDRPENQCGILTARLANEAPQLHKISGQRGGVIVESLAITIITIVLAFYYSWQLALVNMAFLPALVFVGALQVRDVESHVGEKAVCGSEIVQESLSAQRTVASLCLEGHFYQAFTECVKEDKGTKTRQRISYSIVNALAQGIQYFQNAAIYYLGAVLIDGGTLNLTSMFRSISVANFGAQGLGRAASFLPDLNSAITSGKNIFRTLDRVTKLDVTRGDIPSNPIEGNIEFRNVKFAYPTRKTVQVLKGFNFNVEKGANVAFVGQSGCGKSTCLQLVQRLYDVENTSLDGGVYIDGKDLRSIQPAWLRQQIGVVSQEPNLFDLTIKENIAYGDLSRSIPMEEITDAARDANIHDFICSLPEGYDTQVGLRGSQLSGGQKQRIAIARALIRKPTILLLDEATSALDTESERVVQAALSKAMAKSSRTSMVVAHRLNTVETCDKIVVLKDGFAVESGSPSELMARKGHFHALHNLDGIKKKA